MKSLNDSLREEFEFFLNKKEYKKIIDDERLDKIVIKKAFDTLLKYKSDSEAIAKSKTEFENYLINYFKLQKNDNK